MTRDIGTKFSMVSPGSLVHVLNMLKIEGKKKKKINPFVFIKVSLTKSLFYFLTM